MTRRELLTDSALREAYDAMVVRARWYTHRHYEIPNKLTDALVSFSVALGIDWRDVAESVYA